MGHKTENRKLEAVASSYSSGVVPKESIFFSKYLQVPEDVLVKDVRFANRAASHITNTRKSADELLELLQKRKALLFNNQLELKKWASNEHGVTTAFIGEVEKLKAKFVNYENNVCHTAKVLSKKFTMPTVSDFEKKRKRQRQKEQKSKTKKKCKTTKVRNARDLLHKSGFCVEEVEQICPTEYGVKSKRRIAPSQISAAAIKQRKTSLLHLKAIDAFVTELDITSGTSDLESSESDSSDN